MVSILNKFFALIRNTPAKPVSLRLIFIAPYTALVIFAIGITGYVSYRNGQGAVNNVAQQLVTEIASRVEEHLLAFLSTPHNINQYNAESIRSGTLGVGDAGAMHAQFLGLVRTHPTISSVYFGNVEGGIVGSGREGAEGSLYIYNTENLKSGVFSKYGVDATGRKEDQFATLPNFDARTRPWYIDASLKGDAVWSDIYGLFTGQDLAIAASRPVYDDRQNLLGVVSVDIFLTQLSQFLETLDISPEGQIFIMERSGMLVATSTGEAMFQDKNGDTIIERLDARNSSSSLIRQSAEFLLETYKGYQNIPIEQQHLEFTTGTERQFLQLSVVQDRYGIGWIVVVVIPESRFMGQINANNRMTLGIILVGLCASVGGSIVIAAIINARITELNKFARSLASGDWEHEMKVDNRIVEVDELATSFNRMKAQLHSMLEKLTTEINERKRAEEELRAYARQISLLNDITRAGLEQSDLHKTFQVLADRLGELIGADGAYLTLWDETRNCTLPITAYGPLREQYSAMKLETGEMTLTESVLHAGHPLAVEDVHNTPYLSPRIAAMFPAQSILALPLIAGQKKLGAALIAFNHPHNFNSKDIALGEQAARLIALVIMQLHSLQDSRNLAQEQSLLFEAARDFSTGLAEEGVLAAIAHHMIGTLQVDGCTILRYEPEQERVVTMLDCDNLPNYRPVPVGTPYYLAALPAMHHLIGSRQPIVLCADDPAVHPAECTMLEQFGYTTLLMLPLCVGDMILGLVKLRRRKKNAPFSSIDIKLGQSLANTAAVAMENARLHADMRTKAITDSLTGLTNRRHFDQIFELEIDRARRYGYPLALLFLDIDSFKQYNDTYGHQAGDERLKAVAHLLQNNIRQPDLAARFGGEEFILLLPHSDKASALILGERLRLATEDAYRQKFYPHNASSDKTISEPGNRSFSGYTVSIGVASYPEDTQTSEGLLRVADAAMLEAKRLGKNRVCAAHGLPI